MADIGAKLREARTASRTEIAEMEVQTKIRAKYLRALENEEWELLPGPTFVKSFLRTYGDMLGLDGRGLVAEYKRQHEMGHEGEPPATSFASRPLSQPAAGQRRPWRLAIGGLVVAAIAAFVAVEVLGGGEPAEAPVAAATTPAPEPVSAGEVVTVRLRASQDVRVCARAATRIVLPERQLDSGERTRRLRGREVMITAFGPGVRMTVDGDEASVPEAEGPVTFVVTDSGVFPAAADQTACSS